MSDNHGNDHKIPDGYRLVDETTLSFLWFHTAAVALHYFGVKKIPLVSDAERLDCVMRLGKLHQQHSDLLPDESLLVIDCLVTAATDLTRVSRH